MLWTFSEPLTTSNPAGEAFATAIYILLSDITFHRMYVLPALANGFINIPKTKGR